MSEYQEGSVNFNQENVGGIPVQTKEGYHISQTALCLINNTYCNVIRNYITFVYLNSHEENQNLFLILVGVNDSSTTFGLKGDIVNMSLCQ